MGITKKQNNSLSEVLYHNEDKNKIETKVDFREKPKEELKEEIDNVIDIQEQEDDELSKMLNDIRSVIN
ncbi:hypothetical protein [Clostridium sp.]